MPSDFDDDSYDLTSELFLENVDDEFMPNFPSSISPPPASAWRDHHRPTRNSAMIQRINSIRLRNSPGTGRRRTSPEAFPGQRRRRLSPASQFLATGGSNSPVLGSSPTSSNSPTRLRNTMSVNQRNSDQAIYGPHSRGRAGRFRRSNIEQRPSGSRHMR